MPEQQSPFPLQEPPPVQGVTHVPLWQTCPEPQAWPHCPQLETSLFRSLQWPLQQAGVVPLHVFPHAPQLWVSVCSLTHMPLQQLWPAGQSAVVQQELVGMQAPLQSL